MLCANIFNAIVGFDVRPVQVRGSGTSSSQIWCTNGVLVSLEHLDKVVCLTTPCALTHSTHIPPLTWGGRSIDLEQMGSLLLELRVWDDGP